MEIQLIYGPNSSGKSVYAEDAAVASGSKLLYLATMVPQTEENRRRIQKHRFQRQDKGFLTVEAAWNIGELEVEKDTVVLLEDVSNLLANGMFMHGANAQQALADILMLARKCKKLIAVSISGLSSEGYDEETANYIEQLNWLNDRLLHYASQAVEMQEGMAQRIELKYDAEKYQGANFSYFCNRDCEYFPCHKDVDPENFNCLFCYCPLYMLGEDCGGQFTYTKSGRKDCSNCTLPHNRESYGQIIRHYQEITARMKEARRPD